MTQEAGSRCEEARVQKAENPGDVEGLEVKTGYSWKEFELIRREAHLDVGSEEMLLVV